MLFFSIFNPCSLHTWNLVLYNLELLCPYCVLDCFDSWSLHPYLLYLHHCIIVLYNLEFLWHILASRRLPGFFGRLSLFWISLDPPNPKHWPATRSDFLKTSSLRPVLSSLDRPQPKASVCQSSLGQNSAQWTLLKDQLTGPLHYNG